MIEKRGPYFQLPGRATTHLLWLLFLSLIALSIHIPAHAQVQTGISGTVSDPSGAVVSGASVTVTNTSTGVVTNAKSSSAGTFNVVALIPDTYNVSVDAPGFKKVETSVVVEVARISTLRVTMQPGATTETVNVRASEITLNTTSPVIGATLEPELVENAPIEISGLARQVDSFMYLTPGVQGTATNHEINGGVSYQNEVQFNGVPVAFVQFEGNQTYINPPYESISEFRVNSSTFDPQFGLGQGAVTFNMASGTNELHGDAFEIIRNQLFDSDGFFPTHFGPNGSPRPPVNQENNYGFTVGGPVIFPKLYHGKNRTFFHFSGDWFRQNQALNSIGTVPTPAMKSGDFSQFVDASGNLIPIYDPTTGQSFPGNIIPPGRISPLSQSLLPLIPNPDRSGLVSGLVSNKSPAISSIPVKQTLWAYTIDHTISSSQNIHFSQWRDKFSSPSFTSAPIVPSSNELQSESTNTQLGTGFLLNYSKVITPSLVVTVGADAIGDIVGQHDADEHVKFGGVVGGNTFPLTTFDGQNAPSNWGVASGSYLQCCSGAATDINNRMLGDVIVNNWLLNRGRHTLNFGGQFRYTYGDEFTCSFCGGTFNFSQKTTSTPDSSDPNFGNYGSSFASFLLGQVDAAERIFSNELKFRNKAFALYAQDNFKLNNRLTLNYGVRWDVLVPFTESHNDILFVNRTEPDPGAGNLPGAATKFGNCTGCSGITRAAIHWKYFQPRLGLSYQINSKTVVQSGFYLTVLNGGAYEYGTSDVFFLSTLLNGSLLNSSTGSNVPGYGSWDTQAMAEPQQTPFTPSIANAGVVFDFPSTKPNHLPELPNTGTVGTAPYYTSWSFNVQRELQHDMFLTVSYVGNRAVHLNTSLELSNQPNPSVLQYGSLLGKNILDPSVVGAGFTSPYPGFTQQFGGSATLEQALTPFPQFGGFFPIFEMDGTAFYNALQVQTEKRFSHGLSYLADVTISRNVSNQESGQSGWNGVNAYNPSLEWGPSWGLDQTYLVKGVTTYELPFGPGKSYLHSSHGILPELVGGWQISGILNYGGGTPLQVINTYNPLLVNSFDRPNLVPGVTMKTFNYGRSKAYFEGKTGTPPIQFTTNAFVNTGPWQVGNAQRSYGALRTPPLRIENFDAIKTFRIGDWLRASLRVDYFNAFNRTQLQAPDQNSLDSTFGQITNLSSQISNRQGQATFRVEF